MRPATTPPTPRLLRFAPPLLWMIVISILSSSFFGADHTDSVFLAFATRLLPWVDTDTLETLHVLTRRLGHVVEFGILAILWARALAPGRSPGRAAAGAVVLAALYALVDEARQGLAPNRTPSLRDATLDTAGAILAVTVRHLAATLTRARPRVRR